MLKKAPEADFVPVELPSENLTAELSGGKHGETIELPNNLRAKKYVLEDL